MKKIVLTFLALMFFVPLIPAAANAQVVVDINHGHRRHYHHYHHRYHHHYHHHR